MKSYHKLYALSSLAFIFGCLQIFMITTVVMALGGGTSHVVAILMCVIAYDLLSTVGIEYRARARREKIQEQVKTEQAFRILEG